MRDQRIRRVNSGLLLVILVSAACLRLYYIDQPFVNGASWREADDATIADNFYRGQLNIFLPEISWNGPGPNYVGYEFQLITYMAALFYHLFGQGDWVGRGIAYPTEILGSTDSGVNFDAYSRNRLLYLGAPCIAFLPPLPCRR